MALFIRDMLRFPTEIVSLIKHTQKPQFHSAVCRSNKARVAHIARYGKKVRELTHATFILPSVMVHIAMRRVSGFLAHQPHFEIAELSCVVIDTR